MTSLHRRAVALVALAAALPLAPAFLEAARKPAARVCPIAADIRCAWLSGERPPLHRAAPEDFARVPRIGARRAVEIARALSGWCPAHWGAVERRVGRRLARSLQPFFRLDPDCAEADAFGENGDPRRR